MVHLDGGQAAGGRGKAGREHATAGADFQYVGAIGQTGGADDSTGDRKIDQQILPSAAIWPEAGGHPGGAAEIGERGGAGMSSGS